MSQIQQNVVYIILYNYQDTDYSVIKILSSLEKAHDYIHLQEINEYADVQHLTLVEIDRERDISDKCKEDNKTFYVCVFNDNDTYTHKNFRDTEHISSYIIAKMKVE
jgi:hypothetical protein